MAGLFLDAIRRRPDLPARTDYPFSVPGLAGLERLDFTRPITFLAGDNGSGKSTLLEGLAAGMRAYAIGNHGQVISDPYLPHARTFADAFYMARRRYPKIRMFMRAEDVLGYIRRINEDRLEHYRDHLEDQRRKGIEMPEETPEHLAHVMKGIIAYNELDTRSHGEGFLDILEQRLHGAGLYFLDEPESPLSPIRQLALADLIRRTADGGAQLIIATHSPVLLAIPEATILHVGADGVREVFFDELEPVQFLRRFLDRPGRYL